MTHSHTYIYLKHWDINKCIVFTMYLIATSPQAPGIYVSIIDRGFSVLNFLTSHCDIQWPIIRGGKRNKNIVTLRISVEN